MRHLIPIILSVVLITGCASAKPRSADSVKIIPQQTETEKPKEQSKSQETLPEAQQAEATQNTEPAASEVAPPSPEAVPEIQIEAQTEEAELKEGERIHKVDIFESLWSIAEKEYGDGSQWEQIYEANKDQIEDPKVIFPKQELIIPQE